MSRTQRRNSAASACAQPEPETRCVTHSVEATGGGLVECGPVAD